MIKRLGREFIYSPYGSKLSNVSTLMHSFCNETAASKMREGQPFALLIGLRKGLADGQTSLIDRFIILENNLHQSDLQNRYPGSKEQRYISEQLPI